MPKYLFLICVEEGVRVPSGPADAAKHPVAKVGTIEIREPYGRPD
jgi:hypothetical protein